MLRIFAHSAPSQDGAKTKYRNVCQRTPLALLIALCVVVRMFGVTARAGVVLPTNNIEITDAGLNGKLATNPNITAHNGTLYAVWRDARRTGTGTLEADMYFASSSDDGATWSQNRRVTDPDFVGWTDAPTIDVAPDGSIWVAWGLDYCSTIDTNCGGTSLQNDVRVAVSRDGGETWSESAIWFGVPGNDDNQAPKLHADNDRILVLAHEPHFEGGAITGFDVYLVTRILSPLSAEAVRLTTDTGLARANPYNGPLLALAVNGNTVCAAWEDTRDRYSIYGSCSSDRGQSFPAATRWSVNGDDFMPRLAFAPNGTLALTYKDVDKKEIFVRTSPDNGATWSAARQVTNVGKYYTYSYDFSIAPDGQMVFAVTEGATSTPLSSDLYAITSADGGQTFSIIGPIERGDQKDLNLEFQSSVSLATYGSAASARTTFVWTDSRLDRSAVWAANMPIDGVAPTTPSNLRASDGIFSVLLQWATSTDANGISHYDILRATTPGGPYARVNTLGVKQAYYRDVGLTAGTYYYRVIAVDSTANASAQSNEASGASTTGAAPPALHGTLAYITEGGVAARAISGGLAGAETNLQAGSSPAYSVDGKRLYFLRQTAGTWNIMHGDTVGANATSVGVNSRLLFDLDLPLDENIIASVENSAYNGGCIPLDPIMFSLNPTVRLAEVGNILADSVAIAPDRRWLAYTYHAYCDAAGSVLYSSNRLCLLDTLAVPRPNSFCQTPANFTGLDFGNSGNVIVFSANYGGQNEIWRATVTQSGDLVDFIQLTRGPAGQPSTQPRVSTDGNWVVFTRDIDAGPNENLQVLVVRLDGDSVHGMGFAAKRPVWSGGGPSGSVIAVSPRMYLPIIVR